MIAPKSILFVCTGNVFRSVTAEYCLKQYLANQDITDWNIGSAGIVADEARIDPKTLEILRGFGIDATQHQQRRLTREILDSYDAIVGMAQNHIDFIKSEFNYRYAVLFNELFSNEKSSIWDIENEVKNYQTNRPGVEEKIERTVKEIHDKISTVFKNAAERFYLFSDFVGGRISHRNGYPFIVLYETPHSIAFMSVDIPYKEDGHILVIPKKKHLNLSEISDDILKEIFTAIKKIGRALGIDHGGYNVLLNNGLDAGQYMMHTHFHIVPRRSDDGIQIETWKRPPISQEEFITLNAKLKQQIDEEQRSTEYTDENVG